ncbi:MAG TPA: hypothetical protein ENI68_10755 [Gammaproteobacteria bacterium]|nr:hypothetical protein [Gammaproteobacteria bacterium]
MLLAASIAVVLVGGTRVHADERGDLLLLKNTTLNLIEALVEEGVLSREQADRLIANAEKKAQEEAQRAEHEGAQSDRRVVRVPYVPEFVRDEIRQQIEAGVREQVVEDVMAQAKQERWGVPDALPEWISRIKFKGDIRLRGQQDLYSSDNFDFSHIDFQQSNEGGSLALLNSTEDRTRARMRLRIGMDARVTTNLKTGIRLTTGSFNDPVSTNQTLGNYNSPNRLVLDRAYLQYQGHNADGYNWMTLTGGRIPNPWFSTDLIWDKDLNFDGFAAGFRYNLGGGGSLYDIDEQDSTLFATVGAFSLQEVELSSNDKWLFGAQLGFQKVFKDQSSFRIGLAYYNYDNIVGKRNSLDSTLTDYTAPEFMQKGNSLFEISNDTGGSLRRFGLASDYDIVDLTARYDLARFAPVHWILTGSYVKNIGYDDDAIRKRTDGQMFVNSTLFTEDPSKDKTEGYTLKLTVGWPTTYERRSWQAFLSYRYLERDAVLDAFTDSDFFLGGTNSKGWIIGGGYGINDYTWLKVRYLSADEIDGPPLGTDVLQLDLNAKF